MADDAQELELDTGEEKGKSKMMLIIIIAVVLLGGGVGAFFMMGGSDDPPAAVEGEEVDPNIPAKPKEKATYLGVPEAFVSPLKGETKDRMIQIKMSFLVRGSEAIEKVKRHMPRLKNDLLILISRASADVAVTAEGRLKLQEDSLAVVQQTMTELEGEPYIEKVLFVSYVMQ